MIKSFHNSYFLDALFKLWRHEGLRGLYKVSLSRYIMLPGISDVIVRRLVFQASDSAII